MPDVKPGESQNDYMSRCVPMVKDEGATQEQAVGKCLGMYRNATESILHKIDAILESVDAEVEIFKAKDKKWYVDWEDKHGRDIYGPFKSEDDGLKAVSRRFGNPGFFSTDSAGTRPAPKKPKKIHEATVVGTVGKDMEQKLCPKNQVWCPKCNACVDRQERTGMGVPAPYVPETFECPDCKKDKVDFTWENTNIPVDTDLSKVTLFFKDADHDAKWKKLNVKDLTQLQKKTHSKMNPRLTHSLKLQVEKMNVKRLWFYVDPYSDYIYSKRELSWAWEKREADQEIQSGWDAIAEKEPWGEKSFGRLRTL